MQDESFATDIYKFFQLSFVLSDFQLKLTNETTDTEKWKKLKSSFDIQEKNSILNRVVSSVVKMTEGD